MSVVIEEGIVKKSIPSTAIPDADFATFFTGGCDRYADVPALVDAQTGAMFTFGELLDNCRQFATGLRRLGLHAGDVVAIHCANGIECVVALCGVFFAGAIAFLVKTNATKEELQYQFIDVRPKLLICDVEHIEKFKTVSSAIPPLKGIIATRGTSEGALSMREVKSTSDSRYEVVNLRPDTVMVIIFSSGSTGLPKGVQLTHRNIIAQMVSMRYLDDAIFGAGDVCLCSASLSHIGGFWLCFGFLGNGCKVVLCDGSDVATMMHAVQKYQVTSLLLYPSIMLKLNQHPLLGQLDVHNLKKIMLVGGTVPSHLMHNIAKKLHLNGIAQGYGMTELAGAITFSTPQLNDTKTVGKPVPFVEIKVVDVESRTTLGALQQGEICVRGPSAFKGYLGRPEETAGIYEDGFVKTGDTGYYSADGLFYICGRIKELIKCMDQQVAPAELEELLAADAGVRHVVVAGVPHPQFGEAARAFLVPSQHLRDPSEEQQEAYRLKELVAARLAYHKHLHGGIEFLERVPQTTSGKDVRKSVRDSYMQRNKLQ